MTIDKNLLLRFIQEYPFQPAAAFWRAIEVCHITSQPFPEGRGIDLGCGDGKLTKILLERVKGRELIGIDIDYRTTELAKQLGIYNRIHTVPGDAIPEEDSIFDFVFSNSVLEHIENIENVLKEVKRLLKKGGIFLFTVPSINFHSCLKGPLLPFVSRGTYIRKIDMRLGQRRHWDVVEWGKTLFRHGLRIEMVSNYFSRNEVQRWEIISNLTAGVLYTLFLEKKSPIEIQRIFSLDRTTLKTPEIISKLLQIIFVTHLGVDSSTKECLYGCIMIKAKKQ